MQKGRRRMQKEKKEEEKLKGTHHRNKEEKRIIFGGCSFLLSVKQLHDKTEKKVNSKKSRYILII